MKEGTVGILFDSLFEGFYQVDAYRQITFWNKAAERITGYSKREIQGRKCSDNFLCHVNDRGEALCEGDCPLAKTLLDGEVREDILYLRHKQGHRVPVRVRVIPLYDRYGEITGAAEVFTGAAGADQAEQIRELVRRVYMDSLSGLPNRQYIEYRLKERATANAIGEHGSFGMMMLEIDNLKQLNEEYGETVGNAALRVAGQTLLASAAEGDVVGRWYGGRFALLTKADRKSVLLNWAAKLKGLVEQSVIPGCEEAALRLLVGGVVQYNEAAPDDLVRRLENQLRQSRAAMNNISIED